MKFKETSQFQELKDLLPVSKVEMINRLLSAGINAKKDDYLRERYKIYLTPYITYAMKKIESDIKEYTTKGGYIMSTKQLLREISVFCNRKKSMLSPDDKRSPDYIWTDYVDSFIREVNEWINIVVKLRTSELPFKRI